MSLVGLARATSSDDEEPTLTPRSVITAPAEEEPAAAVTFVRSDGSEALLSGYLSAKVSQSQLAGFRQRRLRQFYIAQNETIDVLIADLKGAQHLAGGEMLPEEGKQAPTYTSWEVRAAVNGSFALNVALLLGKLIATIISGSMSALASTADSALDLVSGFVLFAVHRSMARSDPYKYPEGKSRLEPIGVVMFAVVMGMSSLQIMISAIENLVGVFQDGSKLDLGPLTIGILISTIVLKFGALLACRSIAAKIQSSSVETYAQDHFNDVLTNSVAVVAVLLAWWQPNTLAFLDPLGAILIALWILFSWLSTALVYVAKLVGLVAPPELVRRLTHLVFSHDPRVLKVDTCRAYHFGERFLVEVEIVMLPETTLRESHDVGITLQVRRMAPLLATAECHPSMMRGSCCR